MRFVVRRSASTDSAEFSHDGGVSWSDGSLYPKGTGEERALDLLMRSGLRQAMPAGVTIDIDEDGLVRVVDEQGEHTLLCQTCGLVNCGEGPPPVPTLCGGVCPECGEALRYAYDCVGCLVACPRCGWDEAEEREHARREAEETNR